MQTYTKWFLIKGIDTIWGFSLLIPLISFTTAALLPLIFCFYSYTTIAKAKIYKTPSWRPVVFVQKNAT